MNTYPGFQSESEIKGFVEKMRRERGWFQLPPPSQPNFTSKYKPKRSVDAEIKHQTNKLKEAKSELRLAEIGSKLWRSKKIRVAIVARFLKIAKEKKAAGQP